MYAHIVIWKHKTESKKSFLDSLSAEQNTHTVLLSPEENDHYPQDENDTKQWESVLVSLEQRFAQHAADRNEAVITIVHILLDDTSDAAAYTTVGKICEACASRNYKKNLIWLSNKYSVKAEQEKSFLSCALADVRNRYLVNREIEEFTTLERQKCVEREIELARNYPNIYNIYINPDQYLKYLIQRNQIRAERDNAIRAKKQELESQYLKTRWDCLSILFDTDNNGGQSDEILKLRSAAAAGAVFAAEKNQDEFEIRCYGIKKSPYSQEEYAMLPAYCLYEHIRNHQEDITEILNEITPTFSLDISAFACTDEEVLAHALLVDDNNFEGRSAEELLNSFLNNNPEYRLEGTAHHHVRECVAVWLDKIKISLAKWVDLDKNIMSLFAPAGYFENDMRREIVSDCSIEDVYQGIGNFGNTVPLASRLESARMLAQKLCIYLKKALKNAIYEEVLVSLADLRSYLQAIKEINLRVFDPYGKMKDILACNSEWQRKLINGGGIWFGDAEQPARGTPEEYEKWLELTLKNKTETLLNLHGDGEYEVFSAERLDAAEEIKLISNITCYPVPDENVSFTYGGFRCKLSCYKADSDNLDPENLFIQTREEAQDAPKTEEDRQELSVASCSDRVTPASKNINLNVTQRNNGVTLTIPWPQYVTEMRVDVRNPMGQTQILKEQVRNLNRGDNHSEEFTFEKIRPGENTFILTITGGANIGQTIAEKTEIIAVPEFSHVKSKPKELTFIEKVKALFSKKTGYLEKVLDIPKLGGMPSKYVRIQMTRKGHRFYYRHPNSSSMIALCPVGSEKTSFKIVYKDE